MAVDGKMLEAAKSAFATLCRYLDGDDWRYEKDEENLVVSLRAQGEDLPIEAIVKIEEERETVRFMSRMPCKVPEDKRIDMAIAVSIANNLLVEGNFDYDITDEKIIFVSVNSIAGSVLGEKAFAHIVLRGFNCIDEYNDKFLMLSKGMMTLEQFIEGENKKGGDNNG